MSHAPAKSRRQERDRILGKVDEFLADRMRPDNPVKVAMAQQSAVVLAAYYERKKQNDRL